MTDITITEKDAVTSQDILDGMFNDVTEALSADRFVVCIVERESKVAVHAANIRAHDLFFAGIDLLRKARQLGDPECNDHDFIASMVSAFMQERTDTATTTH